MRKPKIVYLFSSKRGAGGLGKIQRSGRMEHCPFLLLVAVIALHVTARSQALAERLSYERSMMGTSVEIILLGPDRDALEKEVSSHTRPANRLSE